MPSHIVFNQNKIVKGKPRNNMTKEQSGMYKVQRVRRRGGGENRPWVYLGKKIGPEYVKKWRILALFVLLMYCEPV